MRCYLVRHGEAVSAQVNPQRPLSARGRAEVAELAQLALSREVRVAELRHSGILRAQETAEILAGYLKPSGGVQPFAGLMPEDDPETAKAELESVEQPILLVGHLPFMSRLAALLVKGDAARSVAEFGPASMLCCVKVGAGWQIDWQIAPTLR